MDAQKQQETQGDKSLKPAQNPARKLPRVVYSPESRIRHPLDLFREMWRDLLSSRDLAWQLLVRDISAQYRQSLLGVIWAFIPPIVAAAGLTLLKDAKIVNLGETDIPYPVYVMFSMTLWQIFTDTMNNTMGAIKSAKGMLSKIRVPPEAFVLAKLGQIFFNFSIQIVLIALLFIWFKVKVTWTLLLAPVGLIHLMMFGTAMGLFLGPISNLYTDISRAMGFITRFWIFATPVIYPLPKTGTWATIVKLNPVTPLLVTTRELATTGVISEPQGFWIASLAALVLFLMGWIFFRLAMPFIVERVASS